jgi:phosphoribosylaminoimidazole-succinocarboxamide synthase
VAVETLVYEGKAKRLYSTDSDQVLLMEYKNSLTAFNALKKGEFEGKGQINCEISTLLFRELKKNHVSSHWLETVPPNKMRVLRTKIIPLEVVVRNRIAGSLAKKFKLHDGDLLQKPLVEFYFKDDALADPFVSNEQIECFGWATREEIRQLQTMALQINQILIQVFHQCRLNLVDFKVEFGRLTSGEIVLSDEISPDSMRVWDAATGERYDKDRFRLDLGDVKTGYNEILQRLKLALGGLQ